MDIIPDTPGSVLSLFKESTAKGIEMFVDTIVTEVEQGGRNALEAEATAAIMEKIAKQIRERVKESAKLEADKYPEREFEVYGVKVTKKAVYTSYDYSHDQEWVRLDEVKKKREAMLKSLDRPFKELDESTGELIEVKPAIKKQTDGIVISFK